MSELFSFENIGRKIKSFTKWSCWILIAASVIGMIIAFIAIIADGDEDFLWMPIVGIFILPPVIYIGCWFTYGFGEIIEKLTKIEINTRNTSTTQTEIDELPEI